MTRRGRERGSAAVELVLVAPILVAMILIVVAGGRMVAARGHVNDAAYAAARAASLDANPDRALISGIDAAHDALADRGKSCANLTVSFAGTDFQPGGQVRVVATCVADLKDVAGFGIPGQKTYEATAVVPIEEHRL